MIIEAEADAIAASRIQGGVVRVAGVEFYARAKSQLDSEAAKLDSAIASAQLKIAVYESLKRANAALASSSLCPPRVDQFFWLGNQVVVLTGHGVWRVLFEVRANAAEGYYVRALTIAARPRGGA